MLARVERLESGYPFFGGEPSPQKRNGEKSWHLDRQLFLLYFFLGEPEPSPKKCWQEKKGHQLLGDQLLGTASSCDRFELGWTPSPRAGRMAWSCCTLDFRAVLCFFVFFWGGLFFTKKITAWAACRKNYPQNGQGTHTHHSGATNRKPRVSMTLHPTPLGHGPMFEGSEGDSRVCLKNSGHLNFQPRGFFTLKMPGSPVASFLPCTVPPKTDRNCD